MTDSPTTSTTVTAVSGAGDQFLQLLGAVASTGAIRIHNARGGFACNSSSSHSIVVLPPGMSIESDFDGDDEFGWNDFALVDTSDKIRYLATMLKRRTGMTDFVAQLSADHGFTVSKDAYVDGESTLHFPDNFFGSATDREFLTDFANLLADPRVAITGGHDNDGRTRHHRDGMIAVALGGYGQWRARKDTLDGESWWVLFNDSDGTKIRLSFDVDAMIAGATEDTERSRWYPDLPKLHNPAPFTPGKAATPELVDVKLTDRCPFERDCGFCYQGSTTTGPEGEAARVANVVAALSRMRVFEIAFGGGEPTTWPAFTQTLEFTRSVGIVPNFTTKNYAWLTGPNAEKWLGLVGAVAFSVNTREAMDRLMSKADASGLDDELVRKISVQLIPDLVPTKDFNYILTEAVDRGWRVTLLGYKTTGRGSTFEPQFRRKAGWWLTECTKAFKDKYRPAVAIDTLLAEQSVDALDEAGVPAWMYHLEEGRFSAYVDTVAGQIGPSSYCDPDDMSTLPPDADAETLAAAMTATFATYLPERVLPC